MIKKKLFIYTSNLKKIEELKSNLPKKKYVFYTLKNYKKVVSPKENGKTFKENAIIKSKFGYKKFNLPCISDDSGICIGALKNGPGIKSNRFQKKLGGYKQAFKKIIKLAKKRKNNKACFVSVIAFTYEKNKTITFEGKVRGYITTKPLGKRGFGYDPIFLPKKSLKTFGQMTKNQKNLVSHRGIAIKKLVLFLKKFN